MSKKIIGILIIILVLVSGYLIFRNYTKSSEIEGLIKIERYRYHEKKTSENINENLVCAATFSSAYDPRCGYCPGIIYEKECYVNLDELSDEEKRYEYLLGL